MIVELITGPLLDNPARVGKPLGGAWLGCQVSRRGDYRVILRIDADGRLVEVLTAGHRADVYRAV